MTRADTETYESTLKLIIYRNLPNRRDLLFVH